MKRNTIERKIVANLCKRFRFAKSQRKKIKLNHDNDYDMYQFNIGIALEKETEAWNAFESSRRILNGFK